MNWQNILYYLMGGCSIFLGYQATKIMNYTFLSSREENLTIELKESEILVISLPRKLKKIYPYPLRLSQLDNTEITWINKKFRNKEIFMDYVVLGKNVNSYLSFIHDKAFLKMIIRTNHRGFLKPIVKIIDNSNSTYLKQYIVCMIKEYCLIKA